MKVVLLLLLVTSALAAGDSAVPSVAEPKPAPPDLRPENALDRIRKRNLFHPTRGVLPKAGEAGAALGKPLPLLMGTLMAAKRHSALLRWSEMTDAQVVMEGDEIEGYKVKKIAQNHVELLDLKGGETHSVELQSPSSHSGGTGNELVDLLNLNKKNPPPPPAKSAANPTLAPASGSRP